MTRTCRFELGNTRLRHLTPVMSSRQPVSRTTDQSLTSPLTSIYVTVTCSTLVLQKLERGGFDLSVLGKGRVELMSRRPPQGAQSPKCVKCPPPGDELVIIRLVTAVSSTPVDSVGAGGVWWCLSNHRWGVRFGLKLG